MTLKVWKSWQKERFDTVERSTPRLNRILLPPSVKREADAITAAIEHCRSTGRRVVLLLSPVSIALIDETGVVESLTLTTDSEERP